MNTGEKTQELFKYAREFNYKIAFANYNCNCDSGVTVFDSKMAVPLFNISDNDKREMAELFEELEKHMTLDSLTQRRNKLNRKIATLKKANLTN
jgi:hypothetical protein